jgi:hypothetical protein
MTKSLFQFIIVFTFNIVYGELIISESDLYLKLMMNSTIVKILVTLLL